MRSLPDILYNFHWVVPGEAARGAQAWAGFWGPFLDRRGIRAIVNLRGRNDDLGWWKSETRIARDHGMTHLDAMLDSRHLPTQAMLARLMECFDTAPRPFMLKCSGGQDRTSFAAALYLLHRDGWGAIDAAHAQYARFPYLHFPKKHQRWLKPFVEFARQDAKTRTLAEWIADGYTPQKLQVWLAARGMGDFHAGIFERPKRSPFQW